MTAPIASAPRRTALRIVSSMATRALLAERLAEYDAAGRGPIELVSVGGVEAARRVRENEAFDLIVLAADALDRLAAEGLLDTSAGAADGRRRIDWVRSATALAVRAGASRPGIESEEDVRRAVLAASRVGVSTGPSGVALAGLFARWGLADEIAAKTVQAPPGVPVGALLAGGEVDLGFQQVSELIGVAGIELLGPLPPPIAIITTFAAAVGRHATDTRAAGNLLHFLADPASAPILRRHGMDPAG